MSQDSNGFLKSLINDLTEKGSQQNYKRYEDYRTDIINNPDLFVTSYY